MVQHVVLLPGAGVPRVEWGDALGEILGGDYNVIAPEIPDADEPHYETWKRVLDEVLSPLEGKIILIGHSLGGSVILKYLAEDDPHRRVAGILSIAAPSFGEDVEEFQAPKDFSPLARIPRIFLYHGSDDDVVAVSHVHEYARKLPQATVRVLDGKGHYFADENPKILIDDIRSISS